MTTCTGTENILSTTFLEDLEYTIKISLQNMRFIDSVGFSHFIY